MFIKRKQPMTSLQDAYESAYVTLGTFDTDEESYGVVLDRIEKLHQMMVREDQINAVSGDTKAQIAANLVGIVLVLWFERANVITSKAFNLVSKPK